MSAPTLPHRFTHEAMATTFEVRLAGTDARYAGQAADAVFALIDRLEHALSRFGEAGDVACINRLAPGEVWRVGAETFACLRLALELAALTGGAFDPALGREMDRVRGEAGEPGARGRLLLDEAALAVQVLDGRVSLDLGAIGKGFALDRAAELLREWGLERALLVAGGGSSVLALDGPTPGEGWPVGVGDSARPLALVHQAVGASGTAYQGGHILDPLTGQPARGPARAWAFHTSAAVADALSTAWMILSPEEIDEICQRVSGAGAILQPNSDTTRLVHLGASPAPSLFSLTSSIQNP